MGQAADILQDYLDRMGLAMLAGDFEIYRAGVLLPFHLETGSGQMIVATEEELRIGFDTFLSLLRNSVVTDYIRIVSEAELLKPGVIRGQYTSHLMSNSQRILPPHDSMMILRQSAQDQVWRCSEIRSSITASQWPIHEITVGPQDRTAAPPIMPDPPKDAEE